MILGGLRCESLELKLGAECMARSGQASKCEEIWEANWLYGGWDNACVWDRGDAVTNTQMPAYNNHYGPSTSTRYPSLAQSVLTP